MWEDLLRTVGLIRVARVNKWVCVDLIIVWYQFKTDQYTSVLLQDIFYAHANIAQWSVYNYGSVGSAGSLIQYN